MKRIGSTENSIHDNNRDIRINSWYWNIYYSKRNYFVFKENKNLRNKNS